MKSEVQEAWLEAIAAREHAYAPYSGFRVGAAIVMNQAACSGSAPYIVSGCNVENASYGATICAERNAILAAIRQCNIGSAAKERLLFDSLVVVTDEQDATPPCAECLQVMAEFCAPDFPIYLANLEGVVKRLLFRDLLPYPFDGSPLQKF